MTTTRLTLPLTFTGPQTEYITADKLISKARLGMLAMFDPAHSAEPLAAGVPAHGAAIPNIAWEQAAALIRAGTQESLKGQFTNLFVNPARAVFERTPKGGIHGMIAQSADAASGQNQAYISLPTLVRDYIFANLEHDYYVSVWSRVTRAAKAGAASELPLFTIANNLSATGRYLFYGHRAGTLPSVVGEVLGTVSAPGNNTVGNTFRNISVRGFHGTDPSVASDLQSYIPAWGAPGPFGSFGSQYSQSHAFYRATLIDLTAAGLTHAEMTTLDQTLHNAAFASGGRYSGDTLSDPAVLVP
jgi:hypothetical protein